MAAAFAYRGESGHSARARKMEEADSQRSREDQPIGGQ